MCFATSNSFFDLIFLFLNFLAVSTSLIACIGDTLDAEISGINAASKTTISLVTAAIKSEITLFVITASLTANFNTRLIIE